jgi:hypothetical protein
MLIRTFDRLDLLLDFRFAEERFDVRLDLLLDRLLELFLHVALHEALHELVCDDPLIYLLRAFALLGTRFRFTADFCFTIIV